MIKVEMISAMNSMKNIIIYLRKVTSLFFKRFLNLEAQLIGRHNKDI